MNDTSFELSLHTPVPSKKSRLRPFDGEKALTEALTKDNPFLGRSLGEIIGLYLNNQNKIGIRQFADRAKLTRKRLMEIIEGAEPEESETENIQSVFQTITERDAQMKAKRR